MSTGATPKVPPGQPDDSNESIMIVSNDDFLMASDLQENGGFLDIIDETVTRISDAEIEERLRRTLHDAGYSQRQARDADPDACIDPTSSIDDPVGRLLAVTELLPSGEIASQPAQEEVRAARQEAGRIVDEVREEADRARSEAAESIDTDDGLQMVQARACGAWILPRDSNCAGIARRLFRRVADALAIDQDAMDDGVTMVGELAMNTLHASADQIPPVNSELWMYLRGTGQQAELVCKVFDPFPGWADGIGPDRTLAKATSRRGFEIMHELSKGGWGHHLTRSRLSGDGIRGKAVWFAIPLSAASPVLDRGCPVDTADEAMNRLEKDLGTRGFSGRLVRADDHAADMAVLSVASGLTVWCRSAAAWLRVPGVTARHWGYSDLVEVGEQAIQAIEMIAAPAACTKSFLPAEATRPTPATSGT